MHLVCQHLRKICQAPTHSLQQNQRACRQTLRYFSIHLGKNSQSVICIFKALTESLIKIAHSAKAVATKGKNQILDPLKLFADNYLSLNKGFIGKLRQKESQLNLQYAELFKYREVYIAASERLEKGRKTQGKLMAKIESGDISEL